MRLRRKIILKIADDTEMKDLLFQTDETLAEIVVDNFTTENDGKLKIAANATETLSFGDVTVVRGFFLKVDQDVIININALGEMQLRKAPGAKFLNHFVEGEISSVTVKAPTLAAVDGVYAFWGDVSA